jgi:hypothetical protein
MTTTTKATDLPELFTIEFVTGARGRGTLAPKRGVWQRFADTPRAAYESAARALTREYGVGGRIVSLTDEDGFTFYPVTRDDGRVALVTIPE